MSLGARRGRVGGKEGGERRTVRGGGGSRIYTRNIPDITKCNKAVDTSIKVRRTKMSGGKKKSGATSYSFVLLFQKKWNEKDTSGGGKRVFELNKLRCCYRRRCSRRRCSRSCCAVTGSSEFNSLIKSVSVRPLH